MSDTILRSDVFNEDCMVGMARYPDGYFDLAIVDPPYGIGVNHNMGRRKGDKDSNYKKAVWDNDAPPIEYFFELKRVSKHQIIWGANHFISRMPFDSACWIMWDKGFSDMVSFAQFELAYTSLPGTCKKINITAASNTDRIHPTQKPIALYKWLLNKYGGGYKTILDTHMGSQSSRIAAYQLGFDYVGFEIDTEYFLDGNKRFKENTAQQTLF